MPSNEFVLEKMRAELAASQQPASTRYEVVVDYLNGSIKIKDTELGGVESHFWHRDEWVEDPDVVFSIARAILEAASNDTEILDRTSHAEDVFQIELSERMQEVASDYLAETWPGIMQADLARASVALAGLARQLAIFELWLPVGLSESQRQDLLHHLYEVADGGEFIHDDVDWWAEGSHTIDYIEGE